MLTLFFLRLLICFCAGVIFARTLGKDNIASIAGIVIFVSTLVLLILYGAHVPPGMLN